MVEVFKSKCLDVLEATSVRWLTHSLSAQKRQRRQKDWSLKPGLKRTNVLSLGQRWQLNRAKVERTRKPSMGGEERCEAKVRQMVADNEDVAMQGGGDTGCTPARLAAQTLSILRGEGTRGRWGCTQLRRGLAQ